MYLPVGIYLLTPCSSVSIVNFEQVNADCATLLLWQVFPMIIFFREKVSQRSDRKLLFYFLLSDMSMFRSPMTMISYLLKVISATKLFFVLK